MHLPHMTPLQALTVNILFQGDLSSRLIQEELSLHGVRMQMPLVYRMLGRLELTEYVRGEYRKNLAPDGKSIRERYYRVTESGMKAWHHTVSFYNSMPAPPDDLELAAGEQPEDDEDEYDDEY